MNSFGKACQKQKTIACFSQFFHPPTPAHLSPPFPSSLPFLFLHFFAPRPPCLLPSRLRSTLPSALLNARGPFCYSEHQSRLEAFFTGAFLLHLCFYAAMVHTLQHPRKNCHSESAPEGSSGFPGRRSGRVVIDNTVPQEGNSNLGCLSLSLSLSLSPSLSIYMYHNAWKELPPDALCRMLCGNVLWQRCVSSSCVVLDVVWWKRSWFLKARTYDRGVVF